MTVKNPPTPTRPLDLLEKLLEAGAKAGRVSLTLDFGPAEAGAGSVPLAELEEQLLATADHVGALQDQLAEVHARLDAQASGLICGHDCNGYACTIARSDWSRIRDGSLTCNNDGCPAQQAVSG